MKRIPAVLAVLFFIACSSSSTGRSPIDMGEPRRVVGTENAVRIDAEIRDEFRAGSAVPITYQITNQRDKAIAIAELLPESSFDRETRMVTVSIGSEVPGTTMLPRLVRIGPGETKSFTAAARVATLIPTRSADPNDSNTTLLRLKVNFLRDTEPFAELIGIPENSVANPKLADELFTPWLEQNEVVYTNAVPVRVTGLRPPAAGDDAATPSPAPAAPRRRRGQ